MFANLVAAVAPIKSQLQSVFFAILAIIVLYTVYVILVPPPDVYQQVLLTDMRRGNELQGTQIQIKPPMRTGGEYTFQTWLYIDNYDYRSGQPKHVFTISSDGQPGASRPPHVTMIGVLYPNENKIMIRVYQAGAVEGFAVDLRSLPESQQIAAFQNPSADTCTQLSNTPGGVPPPDMLTRAVGLCAQSPAAAGMSALQCAAVSAMQKCKNGGAGAPSGSGSGGPSSGGDPDHPDLTLLSNLTELFQGKGAESALKGSLDFPMCDLQNIPLQKWICLTVVMNGRVMDVYMDGKLARSCVLPGMPVVEKGNNYLSLGLLGGWAGAVSTTRFYGYAVTPAVVYELYQEGPDTGRGLNNKYGFAGFMAERLGVRIDYT